MINYIEKPGLCDAITAAGFNLVDADGVFVSENDVAVQAIIDSYDPLPYAKKEKINELKTEGLSRINVVFPAVTDFDELDLIREQWLSIAPAARQPTADFQTMIDIVQAGKIARQAINAMTIVAEIQAYDVAIDPVWP